MAAISTATSMIRPKGCTNGPGGQPAPIEDSVKAHKALTFTCVRNPYARILSSFFDKIAGIQRNGKRYRGNLVPQLIQKYGIEVGSPEDGFRVRPDRQLPPLPAVRARHHPLAPPDGAGHPLVGHVGPYLDLHRQWRPLRPDLLHREVQRRHAEGAGCGADPGQARRQRRPAFNESEGHGPKRAHKVSDYFDDLSRHLIWEIYKKDFQLFKYDFDNPDNKMPQGEVDLDEVHAKLGPPSARSGRLAERRLAERS
jgi:hypothetical protein